MTPMLMMLSREVRRVPLNYEHPKKSRYDVQTMTYVEDFQPVCDRFYVPAVREWLANWERWQTNPDPAGGGCSFEEWDGNGPDPDYHYPGEAWPDGAEMGIRMYESVSEGTPISAVYPDTPGGREAMAQELSERTGAITDGMSPNDWMRVIEGQALAKDIHTGEIR